MGDSWQIFQNPVFWVQGLILCWLSMIVTKTTGIIWNAVRANSQKVIVIQAAALPLISYSGLMQVFPEGQNMFFASCTALMLLTLTEIKSATSRAVLAITPPAVLTAVILLALSLQMGPPFVVAFGVVPLVCDIIIIVGLALIVTEKFKAGPTPAK